jgi:hypothetical protein
MVPEQIAGRMELDGAERAISVEFIYRHAYAGAAQTEARSTTAQRSPRTVDPKPRPNPPATDKARLRSQFWH